MFTTTDALVASHILTSTELKAASEMSLLRHANSYRHYTTIKPGAPDAIGTIVSKYIEARCKSVCEYTEMDRELIRRFVPEDIGPLLIMARKIQLALIETEDDEEDSDY
jgi:hypothetical protein